MQSQATTLHTLTDASHSRTDSDAESCRSFCLSSSGQSRPRSCPDMLEPGSPRPCPAPGYGRRSQVHVQQQHLQGQQHQQSGARSGDRKQRDFDVNSSQQQQQQQQQRGECDAEYAEQKQRPLAKAPREVRRKHGCGVSALAAAADHQADPADPKELQQVPMAGRQPQRAKRDQLDHIKRSDAAAGHRCRRSPARVTQPAHMSATTHGKQQRHTAQPPAASLDSRHDRHHGHEHADGEGGRQLGRSSMSHQPRPKQLVATNEQVHMRKKLTHSRPASAARYALDNQIRWEQSGAQQAYGAETASHQQKDEGLPCQAVSQHQSQSSHLTSTEQAWSRIIASSAGLPDVGMQLGDRAQQQQQDLGPQPAGLQQVALTSGLQQAGPVSGLHSAMSRGTQAQGMPDAAGLHGAAPRAMMLIPAAGAGLHGIAPTAEGQAAATPFGSAPVSSATGAAYAEGLFAAAPGGVLHADAPIRGLQEAAPGPMQALMIALENMTSASQQKLAALEQTNHQLPSAFDATTSSCLSGQI